MAVPDTVSLRHLEGTYTLNKSLSDDSDAILKMQSVSWFVRNAIYYSTIVLHVKEYTDDAGIVHIDIEQSLKGGITSLEERALNWEYNDRNDKVFGKVKGRSRFVKPEELEDGHLKNGWDEASLAKDEGMVVQSYVESTDKNPNWTADQVWGFEIVEGKRRYVRHVFAAKGKEEHRIKLVYDWTPGA